MQRGTTPIGVVAKELPNPSRRARREPAGTIEPLERAQEIRKVYRENTNRLPYLEFGLRERTVSFLAARHRKEVAQARRRWIRQQGFLDTTRLVFTDETAITTKWSVSRAAAARGERLVSHVPQEEWKTITFIAGLRHDRMTASMAIEAR